MRHGYGFRALAALITFGIVALLIAGAYGAGFSAGSGDGPGAAWPHAAYFWPGHILGFLFGLFVLLLVARLTVFALFGGHHRHWHHAAWDGPEGFGHHSRPSHGDWHRGPWHEARCEAFDEWHRSAHSADSTPPPSSPGNGG